ncbi:MAG: T9SS type A sorting domain-containing protein [Bacteroidales bacterium]|nr:T9SS type A sorting domain-containing protein [Bacteroidales bacterium]
MFRITRHIAKLLPAFALLCGSVLHAGTWQGDGSASNPWQISTAQELHELALFVNESQANANLTNGMHFRIMKNIDLTAFLGTVAENPRGWEPIGRGLDLKGNRRHAFQGHLHGGGHVISGLRINRHHLTENRPENFFIGLFGIIENATIDSLGVEVAEGDSVRGGNFTGILVGSAHWNSTIEQVYTKGYVSGQLFVGGLAGKLAYSRITNSYSTADVYGRSRHIGGLVGQMYFGGSITYSYAAGHVEGYTSVGGLVGYVRFNDATIRNTFVASETIDGHPTSGRIAGYNFESNTHLTNNFANSALPAKGGYSDGSGRSLEILRNPNFFTNAINWYGDAWDFENVWTMEPRGFPIFRWQLLAPIIPPILDTLWITGGATIYPPFHPDTLNYVITLPCDRRDITFHFDGQTGDTIRVRDFVGLRYLDFPYTGIEGNITQLQVRVSNPLDEITYNFTIRTPYDSIRIIKPYPNALMVVNRPDLHGGQLFLETGYQWFRDGALITGVNRGILNLGRDQSVGNSRFSVEVTHTDGTTNMICPISWTPTVHSLQVFPNPTEGPLTVVSESLQNSRIEVFTIDGRLVEVINSTGKQTEIDLSHLQPGTYVIRQNGQTVVIVKR